MDRIAASYAPMDHGRSSLRVRCALWTSVAAGALAFESGIVLTSARLWTVLDSSQLPLSQSLWLTRGHLYASVAAAAAALVALLLSLRDSRRDVMAILAAVFVVCCAGSLLAPSTLNGAAEARNAAIHAISGQAVFAGLMVAAVLATIDLRSSQRVSFAGGFPLRGVALWLPPVLLSQIAMGALYRHDIWNIMPHMGGAMAAAFLIVAEAVVLLQRAPEHRLLGISAKAALWFVLIQVLLGISDFLMRLLEFQNSSAWFALSIAHASLGCFTFAAGSCLAFVARVVLDPKAAESAVSEASSEGQRP